MEAWFVVILSLNHIQLFCDRMDCGLPGSSVYGISNELPFPFLQGSSRLRDFSPSSST